MSSIEEQVVMVMSIIPDFGQDMVRKALSQSKGNVEIAIDLLLTGQIQSTQNSTFDEDMLLAQKLQNELNLEPNSSYNEDELLAQQLSAEDPDEIYAKFLQQQINQQSVGNYGVVPTYNTNFDINSIDSNVVNEMINQVKGEIIPMITNELQNVKIPDINEEIEAGKVGKVAFGVKGVAMSQVIVPSDKLKISLNGAQISIEIADISASMQEFEWYYRKESFPKLKDDGKGNASVSSCKIMANLMFGMGPTGPSLTVTSSSVTIEKLDLKISGTAASFFYNFIISAFKSTIKSNMEKTLSDMVRDTMNEGTQGFLSAFE